MATNIGNMAENDQEKDENVDQKEATIEQKEDIKDVYLQNYRNPHNCHRHIYNLQYQLTILFYQYVVANLEHL